LLSKESKALTIPNPWLSFGLKARQIGLEAQGVIAVRMLRRLSAGGVRAEAEASRMVTEKILAAGEAQMAAAAVMSGRKKHVIARKALNVYRQ
jgi:hypothetical protein